MIKNIKLALTGLAVFAIVVAIAASLPAISALTWPQSQVENKTDLVFTDGSPVYIGYVVWSANSQVPVARLEITNYFTTKNGDSMERHWVAWYHVQVVGGIYINYYWSQQGHMSFFQGFWPPQSNS